MGRIDPSPPRPGRGSGSPAGWIVAGILAVVLAALVAFEFGKRSRAAREVTAAASLPRASVPSSPPPAPAQPERSASVDAAPQEGRFERAVIEVTIARPLAQVTRGPTSEPSPEPRATPEETLRDKMVRCLTLDVQDDLIHSAVPRETGTQVRVSVWNSCSFSFVGPDVWYEIRAIPRQGGGTGARKVGRFNGGPIEARSRAELVTVLECPACYEDAYRYEARLWWASGEGRTE